MSIGKSIISIEETDFAKFWFGLCKQAENVFSDEL